MLSPGTRENRSGGRSPLADYIVRGSWQKRCLAAVLPFVCAIAITSLPSIAQLKSNSGSAQINGTVRSANQEAIAGALVTLQTGSSGTKQEARTDSKGAYCFKALEPGNYTLHVETSSREVAFASVSLLAAETKAIDLTLVAASSKAPEFYDQPSFTVAGVSESSGAGVHGSQATMHNADTLAKDTASLAISPGNSSTSAAGAVGDKSIEQLREAIASNDQAQLHSQLGRLEENLGQFLEALREFQRAAEMDPSEGNYFDWGTELLMHRAAAPAAEVFTKGSRLHPQSVRLLVGLAVADYAQGLYHEAVDHLCQASDLDPHDPVPYTFLGKMQNPDVKRSGNALRTLARYAQMYPDDVFANYYYAAALLNQTSSAGDSAAAVQIQALLQKSLAIDPKFAPAYLQLGILDTVQQHFRDAIANFEKAIAFDPSLHEAHYRLAQAYRRLGESDKAQRETEIYQREMAAEDEEAKRVQKNMQQFVYELKTAEPPSLPQ